MKLLSLFDGSGGFPLAGVLCGITPIAASEVEPYPIAVTKSRFPNMKHLGDITKINGAEIEPADIITFGSPCQDLSVAGKQAGLKHETNGDDETTRSGLFMEAVRIIKEMRGATNGKYPRFAVWENVPGAFSSNKGEDFKIVLEELIKITEPTAVMPEVPTKGWAYADHYCGDGWSLAYRVLDAQYIRTAQRRRRIYLVLDLGGQCAREILFERQSLRGHSSESRKEGQGTSTDVEGSVGTDDREGAIYYGISSYDSNAMKSSNPHSGIYEADSSRTLDLNGGNPACNQGGIAVVQGVDIYNTTITGDKVCSLTAGGYGSTGTSPKVMLCVVSLEPGIAAREGGHIYENVSGTLMARDHKGIGRWDTLGSAVCVPTHTRYIIRRLTPTECARLQGFPDKWGHIDHKDDFTDEEYEFWLNVRNTHAEINGKQVKDYTKKQMLAWYNKLHTDSAECKLWGNGIALPCALFVMEGIAEALK